MIGYIKVLTKIIDLINKTPPETEKEKIYIREITNEIEMWAFRERYDIEFYETNKKEGN